jgi:hypothetical protein
VLRKINDSKDNNFGYNAGSISSLMLTTEALVAEIAEEKKAPAGGGGMGDMY